MLIDKIKELSVANEDLKASRQAIVDIFIGKRMMLCKDFEMFFAKKNFEVTFNGEISCLSAKYHDLRLVLEYDRKVIENDENLNFCLYSTGLLKEEFPRFEMVLYHPPYGNLPNLPDPANNTIQSKLDKIKTEISINRQKIEVLKDNDWHLKIRSSQHAGDYDTIFDFLRYYFEDTVE